jgi:hypothetical protein
MAAGAIPPPLFFERRRRKSTSAFRIFAFSICSGIGILRDVGNNQQRRSLEPSARRAHLRLRANGHPAKDI